MYIFPTLREKTSMRSFVLLSVVGICAGCSTPHGAPLYEDIGIRLSGQVNGTLVFRDNCFFAKPADGSAVILVLPRGTIFRKSRINLPPRNGGATAAVGEQVKLTGGFIEITGHQTDPYRASPCHGDAFIVNTLETGRDKP